MQPHRISQPVRRGQQHAGFIYIWLLLYVAITSAALASSTQWYSATVSRQQHAHQQWILDQYSQAIRSYRQTAPNGERLHPPNLEALVLDSRHATTRRHIRTLYVDPVTGKLDWQLVRSPDGGIAELRPRLSASGQLRSGN